MGGEGPERGRGLGGLARLLGVRRVSTGEGRARFALDIGPQHLNPYGAAHGGIACTLLDYAMGAALHSRLEPGERCTTIELKVQYVRPVSEGELTADATVVERTRRLGVLEARAHGADGRLVALATGTFFIVAADRADASPGS